MRTLVFRDARDGLFWPATDGADPVVGVGGVSGRNGHSGDGSGVWRGSEPVQSWLMAAAEQLRASTVHFLVELKPEQVRLDEPYAPLAYLLESDANLVEFSSGSS